MAARGGSVRVGRVDLSCVFATHPDTPEHVEIAERLGYTRAWFYDSAALYPDVWVAMTLAAQRTQRIGLGTGVLVPRFRHVLATAAAAAHVELLAPGRLTLGIGTGFTGSRALGQKAMKWADVEAYATALTGLLRGETVEWEGARIRMLHPPGFAAPRPLDVPIVIAAEGPKGLDVARRVGQGVFTAIMPPPDFTWSVRLVFGTVLDEGEAVTSDRVAAAAGAGAVVAYHASYELGGRDAVLQFPGGEAWVERIEAVDEAERHLAIHEGHLVELNPTDAAVLPRELIGELTFTGTPEEIRGKVAGVEAQGVTELAYQPMGPDIPRELETFMAAVGG